MSYEKPELPHPELWVKAPPPVPSILKDFLAVLPFACLLGLGLDGVWPEDEAILPEPVTIEELQHPCDPGQCLIAKDNGWACGKCAPVVFNSVCSEPTSTCTRTYVNWPKVLDRVYIDNMSIAK